MTHNYKRNDFFHETSIHIRFRDLDPLQHVNNAVFNTYFEEARISFIQAVPELRKSMNQGFSFVLAHLDLKYIHPVEYGESLIIGSSLESIGNSSVIGIQALFSNNDKLKAIAKTTGVWYNTSSKRPARLPEIDNAERYLFKGSRNG
ncbi:acyl-CoA thioesterase [Rhodohalobacter sp. 8-1]|uniref:acyl-CoA thioesterase n=1 Tax=Rhodohalobacter sp. 8-1 TaxID=3131972 RepID=UPI0030EF5E0D